MHFYLCASLSNISIGETYLTLRKKWEGTALLEKGSKSLAKKKKQKKDLKNNKG